MKRLRILMCTALAVLMVTTPVFAENIYDPINVSAKDGDFASEVHGDLNYRGPQSENPMLKITAGDPDSQNSLTVWRYYPITGVTVMLR